MSTSRTKSKKSKPVAKKGSLLPKKRPAKSQRPHFQEETLSDYSSEEDSLEAQDRVLLVTPDKGTSGTEVQSSSVGKEGEIGSELAD
jgi:hypothetical protein